MATIMIQPFDDISKRKLFAAVAKRGQAAGIEAAVKILAELANHNRRVVGTNEIKEVAAAMAEKAREIRASADAEIAELEKQT